MWHKTLPILISFSVVFGLLSAPVPGQTAPTTQGNLADRTLTGDTHWHHTTAEAVLSNVARQLGCAYSVEDIFPEESAASQRRFDIDMKSPTARQVLDLICSGKSHLVWEEHDQRISLRDDRIPKGDLWPLNRVIPTIEITTDRLSIGKDLARLIPGISGPHWQFTEQDVDPTTGYLLVATIAISASRSTLRDILNKYVQLAEGAGEFDSWRVMPDKQGNLEIQMFCTIRPHRH